MGRSNEEFEIGGVSHVALVCRDMARTVDFYQGVLGMPLVKTIELPVGMGQHFFFDIGNGDCLAFFWFPNAPEPAPGVSAAPALPTEGEIVSAIGSMNHLAFNVPAEQVRRLRRAAARQGHRGAGRPQPRRQRVGRRARGAPPTCSSGRSTSSTPTACCSSSRRGPGALTDADVRHEPARAVPRNADALT